MTNKSKTYNPTSTLRLGLTSVASISMRAYFSTYFLWTAEHFSKLAAEIEDSHEGRSRFSIEHRAYVMNSILSSVAFLEAAINELYQDAYDNHPSYLENIDEQLNNKLAAVWEVTEQEKKRTLRPLEKYQILLGFAGKDKFITGENPYQNAKFVIELRNFITHYKPMSIGGKVKHKLEGHLRGRFALNKMLEKSSHPDFPDKMLSKGCAEWSLQSVKNFADEFFEKMEIEPNYQKVDMNMLAGKKWSPQLTI